MHCFLNPTPILSCTLKPNTDFSLHYQSEDFIQKNVTSNIFHPTPTTRSTTYRDGFVMTDLDAKR